MPIRQGLSRGGPARWARVVKRSLISVPTREDASQPGFRLSIPHLARNGALAGLIKLASAALAFLMFAVIATVMDAREFGLFSTTFAGASLVSFFASVGQQGTVLRFWPQYAGTGDLPAANALMARAIVVALAGGIASGLLIVLVGFLPFVGRGVPEWLPLCLGASVLAFALGWTEFLSGAFRAKNAIVFGLLPRDVLWRAATIGYVLFAHLSHRRVGAVEITFVAAAILLVVAVPQVVLLFRQTLAADRAPLAGEQKREFNSVTLGLWGVTALPPALGQVSTLIVAAILGPEAAGAIFVAERTTRLVLLMLSGVNQALAPQISAAFYRGEREHVERITRLASAGSLASALVILAVFVFAGTFILSIFDQSYATPQMHVVLILFALGATTVTACGPIELLLQLTGLQNELLKVLVVVNVLGLLLTALTTDLFGPVGAAAALAATVVTWNLIAVWIARRRIGINPTIVGLAADLRGQRLGPAWRRGS